MPDYLLVYKAENGRKMAAVPDVEGVYQKSIPFSEYTHKIKNNEIVILEVKNLYSSLKNDDHIVAEPIGRFIGSTEIKKCVKELGFQSFFTSVIKEYIKTLE